MGSVLFLDGQELVQSAAQLAHADGLFEHPVNAEMAWFRDQIVERVNGRRIGSLEDLARAFEEHDGEHHLIEFATARRFCVLDRSLAERAHPEILKRYGIPRDRHL